MHATYSRFNQLDLWQVCRSHVHFGLGALPRHSRRAATCGAQTKGIDLTRPLSDETAISGAIGGRSGLATDITQHVLMVDTRRHSTARRFDGGSVPAQKSGLFATGM
jgi:hypothetical protein